ncbi:MAG: XRE family transcriptional regulator [Ruminococcus sp.]|nr:XRE family transcriptional regulator [Ruminococcus sp.]MCD7773180.1 XRE family transcriptional regulator [Ruminococcus sp.]
MMNYNIKEVANRLKGLRLAYDLSVEEFCEKTGIDVEQYKLIEAGEKDFSVTFLYKCSEVFDVDLVELLTGSGPHLSTYSIVRKDKGLPIERRERFAYQHLAYLFKDKDIEPLLVKAPFEEGAEDKPIALSVHKGQEWDYILKGKLKFLYDGHTEYLSEGDSLYYSSNKPHGMIAVDGEDCDFLAILIKEKE